MARLSHCYISHCFISHHIASCRITLLRIKSHQLQYITLRSHYITSPRSLFIVACIIYPRKTLAVHDTLHNPLIRLALAFSIYPQKRSRAGKGFIPANSVELLFTIMQAVRLIGNYIGLAVRLAVLFLLLGTVVATALFIILVLFYSDNYIFV